MKGTTATPSSGEDAKLKFENKDPGSGDTAIVENSETERRTKDAIQALEQELQLLRERVETSDQEKAELEDKNADLAKKLDGPNNLLTSNLNLTILEFVTGFLGWSPILPFNICGGDGNRKLIDGRDPSGLIERIWVHVRIPFFVFGSVLDFADAILDLIVATSDILQGSCNEVSLPGWALWFYTMTLLARALGGGFAVLYSSIPESDREITYFLVEMTILLMEDIAAVVYIELKLLEGAEFGVQERINYILSLACFVLFAIPALCRYKTFTKELPRYISCAFLGHYIMVALGGLFLMIVAQILPFLGIDGPVEKMKKTMTKYPETFWCSAYSVSLSVQLFFLYHWIQHLINKERKSREEQRRDLQQGDPLILTPQEISG